MCKGRNWIWGGGWKIKSMRRVNYLVFRTAPKCLTIFGLLSVRIKGLRLKLFPLGLKGKFLDLNPTALESLLFMNLNSLFTFPGKNTQEFREFAHLNRIFAHLNRIFAHLNRIFALTQCCTISIYKN